MTRQTNSLEETAQVAAECLASLEPRQQATVLALRGDLGAGKTAFTQALAKHLGVGEIVTSPTFVIMKIYDLENQKFDRLIHIDAYRFDNPDELDGLNFQDFLKDPKNLIVLEWPEKVEDVPAGRQGKLPAETIFIDFKFISDAVREISYL